MIYRLQWLQTVMNAFLLVWLDAGCWSLFEPSLEIHHTVYVLPELGRVIKNVCSRTWGSFTTDYENYPMIWDRWNEIRDAGRQCGGWHLPNTVKSDSDKNARSRATKQISYEHPTIWLGAHALNGKTKNGRKWNNYLSLLFIPLGPISAPIG